MSKNINSYVYSDPSGIQPINIASGVLGAYQYSAPSEVQPIEVVAEQLQIEFVSGSADVYQSIRGISEVVRVMDTFTGVPSSNPADVFEYSLELVGEPLVWQSNGDGNINIADPDAGIASGHMEANYDLVVRVSRSGSFISPGTITKTFHIDEVAPVVTATPVSGSYPSGQAVTLSVVDGGNAIIYYTTDGSVPDAGSSQYNSPIPIPALGMSLNFFAKDEVGNQSLVQTNTYSVDDVAPVITYTPSDVFLAGGETCELSWSVDEDCGRVVIEVGGDGVNIGSGTNISTYTNVVANNTIVTSISASVLSIGISNIHIYAEDEALNQGHETFAITYSTQIPQIDVDEVFRHALAVGETATVVWRTNIEGDYEVRVGGANPGDGVLVINGHAGKDVVMETAVPDTLLTANVDNLIKIYVTSSVGNVGASALHLTLDTLPPVLGFNHYETENPFVAPFILTISATDDTIAGIPTNIGENEAVAPYTFDIPTYEIPNVATDLNIGLYQYTDPSIVQSLAVTSSVVVPGFDIGTYKYSDPSDIRSLNVVLNININNVNALTTATTATISWDTDVSANSEVHYSTDPALSSGVLILTDINLLMSHSIGITGLQAAQTYFYKVVSTVGANTEESAILSFLTQAVVDTTPPTITNVLASAIAAGEVLITWDTDEPANTSLEIGLASDLSDAVMQPVTDVGGVLHHSVNITGLNPDTTYYYLVHSSDVSTNANASTYSTINSVNTLDTQEPIISNVTIQSYKNVAIVRWVTNEIATGQLQYGSSIAYGSVASDLDTTLKLSHEVLITGLIENSNYHFNITSEDISGNPASVVDRQFVTLPDRDDRIAIYATTDGSIPTTSNFGHQSIGIPLNIPINVDTDVKVFASDGFGNHSIVVSQGYSFDAAVPVITFDSMTPTLLGRMETSVIRFKVDKDVDYEILNHVGTVLASGSILQDVWTDSTVSADDMVEGINHITIRAEDSYGHSATLQIGHIIKDTVAVTVAAVPAGGFYHEDVYVDLIPQDLRSGEQVTIYYTTDGSMPDMSSTSAVGQVNDIHISDTATIRWFSVDGAGNIAPADYANYTLDRVKPTVGVTPLPGTFDSVIYVTLIPSEPADIYYTLDDSIPTEDSPIFTAPIQIMRDTVVRCFAKDVAGNISPEIYAFDYRIEVIHDKKFKKVIGFQDKMLLETEINEMQDNLNRRIEELSLDVIGGACTAFGFDLTLSEYTLECIVGAGRGYIDGKFVPIVRGDQCFIPSTKEIAGDKTFTLILKPNEPIFKPRQPGQPGWEAGVPEITTYRLEEGYVLDVVEDVPEDIPLIQLYKIFRPATAIKATDCTVEDIKPRFESLCHYQHNTTQAVSELQANLLALGLEVESYKLRNLLGLKNAFVDTFESTGDVDMSKSVGFKYNNTRFEL